MPPTALLFPELRGVYAFVPFAGTVGQLTEKQFEKIRDAGFQTVINRAPSSSTGALADEDLVVGECGMDCVPIPVRWQDPKPNDVARFFAAMDERKNTERLFAHCIANMRVSAFLYLYRVLREGMPEPDARVMLRSVWTPNEWWQAFIDDRLQHYGEGHP